MLYLLLLLDPPLYMSGLPYFFPLASPLYAPTFLFYLLIRIECCGIHEKSITWCLSCFIYFSIYLSPPLPSSSCSSSSFPSSLRTRQSKKSTYLPTYLSCYTLDCLLYLHFHWLLSLSFAGLCTLPRLYLTGLNHLSPYIDCISLPSLPAHLLNPTFSLPDWCLSFAGLCKIPRLYMADLSSLSVTAKDFATNLPTYLPEIISPPSYPHYLGYRYVWLTSVSLSINS